VVIIAAVLLSPIGSRDLGGTDALPKLPGRKRDDAALLRPVRDAASLTLPGLRL
jgi:hypothetical protein